MLSLPSRSNQEVLIEKSLRLSMDETNLVCYDEIKSKMKPFDIIGFRGGDIISGMISKLESYKLGVGAFSHVGMVVTADILPYICVDGKKIQLKPNHPYVFESTFSFKIPGVSDGPPNIVTGKGKLGVQLRDLEEVIPRYITKQATKIAWCRLRNNPFDRKNTFDSDGDIVEEPDNELETRRKNLRKKFTKFFNEYENRLYELDVENLLAAMFPCLRFIRKIKNSIMTFLYNGLRELGLVKNSAGPAGWQFCSELIANVYQTIGVIPKSFDPRDVLPVDFFGYDEDGLPVLVDAPIYIKDWEIPNHPAVKYKLKEK